MYVIVTYNNRHNGQENDMLALKVFATFSALFCICSGAWIGMVDGDWVQATFFASLAIVNVIVASR